ncbi:MAG TPA: CHAT domain-containing protein [Leptolyngbyaceae cyanobacterium M65_K2018_010]|nr:CHAT domain-containing protein [Leptolyngbyaceae cyanobacterium M65_K2018_010]
MSRQFPWQWLGARPAWRRWLRYGLIGLVSGLACLLLSPALASFPPAPRHPASIILAQATLAQGQQLYEAGRYSEAVAVLEQVAASATDASEAVVALRNLALVQLQLGQWEAAQASLDQAQGRLAATPNLPDGPALRASVLEVQGSVELDQGQAEAALASWEQALALYRELDQPLALAQVQVNQAQALQQLGFHRLVVSSLSPLVAALAAQPPGLTQSVALRSLGDSLVQVGSWAEAEAQLTESLAQAQALPDPAATATAALSLGNLKLAQGDAPAAQTYFNQAMDATAPTTVQVQAQLNRLKLYSQTQQVAPAQSLWPTILASLDRLPPSQPQRLARINLGQSLIDLQVATNPTPRQIADILAVAVQQSRAAGDRRTESYALGTLAHLYETQQQWQEAESLTQSALALAQTLNAKDIAYRWQGQLGRLYQAEGDEERAIAAYTDSIKTLKLLRADLVAVNPAVQVSFQDNVEPIHRELVSLLLSPKRKSTPDDLEVARQTIESLQLAELDNFFREACLNAAAVEIDQLDQRAAVVYPIILGDRLEVILSLPNQTLRHYSSPVTAAQLGQTIDQLRKALVLRVGNQYLAPAQQLYDWMIRPAAPDLAASGVDTLVFVLDGELRNIPMAVLNDGEQFLLERYSLALTPGLQLIDPKPIEAQALRVLTAGLSESRQGFSSLPNVVDEVQEIEATVPATVLLNEQFTNATFQDQLTYAGTPIVHMATHGKFSSTNEDTFVLTWDGRLDITDLNNLLQISELNQAGPIELLVLSACQTATGDKQAALGMAGMAVRSGARSTIATLWQVNDEATGLLMSQLYSDLAGQTMTKAEALRDAQLKVLQDPQFRQHPYYWAPYVLLGNWL